MAINKMKVQELPCPTCGYPGLKVRLITTLYTPIDPSTFRPDLKRYRDNELGQQARALARKWFIVHAVLIGALCKV